MNFECFFFFSFVVLIEIWKKKKKPKYWPKLFKYWTMFHGAYIWIQNENNNYTVLLLKELAFLCYSGTAFYKKMKISISPLITHDEWNSVFFLSANLDARESNCMLCCVEFVFLFSFIRSFIFYFGNKIFCVIRVEGNFRGCFSFRFFSQCKKNNYELFLCAISFKKLMKRLRKHWIYKYKEKKKCFFFVQK